VNGESEGFEWDEAKSQACTAARGFDFAYVTRLWHHPVLEREDSRKDYGEIGIQVLGQIDGLFFVAVYTWREKAPPYHFSTPCTR
jgi:uncharacterized DUF497 family protein